MLGIVDGLAVAGTSATFYFGVRSLLQSGDAEVLQRALRAYNQAIFNNLWYIGDQAEKGLKAETLEDAERFLQSVDSVSQAARHTIVAFGEEHAFKKPYFEPAWQPKPLGPPSRPWYRKFFRL